MSASQALQPAAETWRSWRDLPNSFLKCCLAWSARAGSEPSQIRASLVEVPMPKSWLKVTKAPSPTFSQRPQNVHLPRSIFFSSQRIASCGQIAAHWRMSAGSQSALIRGSPRYRL
ncbi:MAG: hypothetical protein ACD_75C01670G0002 [uncultured bacterium]|nr:MAG: hypothetical protein ACD_75C01670G0002 [uncultured bacterium]